jgi:integrase
MGTYQRGNSWWIEYKYKKKRYREAVGPDENLAIDVLAKRKVEIRENRFFPDKQKDVDPIRFHDFAKEFLEWAKANHKSSSRARELCNMRSLEEAFQNKNIHEITTWEIEKWKVKRKEKLKIASVNRELAMLKSMLFRAVEWKHLKESPAKGVKLLKGATKRLRYLMPDELQRLISNCVDYLKPIVIVLVHTGMRKGEALSLRWDQVDFDKGIITLTDTKNNECRYVPMDQSVKTTLGGIERKTEYVFTGKKQTAFVSIQRSFHNALEESKIEDFTVHDLRHTFASTLVMNGTDLNTVRELLGHKDMKMTLRYAHLAPDHKMRAVNILDQVFVQKSPQEKEQERKVLEFKR